MRQIRAADRAEMATYGSSGMAPVPLSNLKRTHSTDSDTALQAHRLQRLEDAVSETYQSDQGAQNQSLLIDLSKFWEILEYSSNSDADSARRLFGESLYAGPPSLAAEVSQTSPLPEPTRLDSQEEDHPTGGGLLRPRSFSAHANFPMGSQDYTASSVISPHQLNLSNDEFSILATNFFSQGQEFLRSGDNWGSYGNF